MPKRHLKVCAVLSFLGSIAGGVLSYRFLGMGSRMLGYISTQPLTSLDVVMVVVLGTAGFVCLGIVLAGIWGTVVFVSALRTGRPLPRIITGPSPRHGGHDVVD